MLKTILIDDEQPVLNMLEGIVNEYCDDVDVVATAGSVVAGLKAIKNHQPDLLFLDINLSDGTGFDLLNQLEEPLPMVVFVTAYDEYAVKAFRFSAIDYIMKPINIVEIEAAVEKCKLQQERSSLSDKLRTFLQNIDEGNAEDKKIVLKTAESIHIIKIGDIIRLESDHNYTRFYLKNGQKLLVSKTLKEYDDLLDEFGFFRSHQSHLINVNYINRFDKAYGGEIVMTNDDRVPVSKRKRDELFDLFEKL